MCDFWVILLTGDGFMVICVCLFSVNLQVEPAWYEKMFALV